MKPIWRVVAALDCRSLTKRPLLRIVNITVMNGVEMTTTNDATVDSIDFREIRSLVAQDYMQARRLASKLEQPLQRANYLTAVATSVLKSGNLSTLPKN